LHKYVTERVPIVAFFVSADQSIKIKLAGFVSSSTAAKGLMVSAESPSSEPDAPTPSFMQ
jgi:hypothetical protein